MKKTSRSKVDHGGTHENLVKLKREIGILDGIGIVMSITIGSGIFVSPVGVLRYTKSVGLSLIMWVMTGVFSLFGAAVYAELGVLIPKNGGDYIYINHVIGPLAAFATVWIILFVLSGTGTAANALIFANYLLRSIYGDGVCFLPPLVFRLIALTGLLLFVFVNCYNIKWVARLSIVSTVCKVLALVSIMICGLVYLIRGNTGSFEHAFQESTTSPGDLALSFYHGYWAFSGWECINTFTREVRNPSRNLPIIIIVSIVLVTIIYVFTNVAYLAVLSSYELLSMSSGSNVVAEAFARRTMSHVSWIVPLVVAVSVMGSMNVGIMSTSRIGYAASLEGHLPAVFSMLHITYLSPIPAVLGVAILSVVFLFMEDTSRLIEMTGFAFIVITIMTTSCLIHLRRTTSVRPAFHTPIWIPYVYLITNIFVAAMTCYSAPRDCLISLSLMAIGVPLYLIGKRLDAGSMTVRQAFYDCTLGLQKLFTVAQPEAEELVITASGIELHELSGMDNASQK